MSTNKNRVFPHFLLRWKSFKLWLISGTNAVYSCKKAGFTLMCKDLDNDEEGAWKRYKEKILSKCLGNSTWLSSIANRFSFFEWSFLLNCVTSFWASNAKLTEASETFSFTFQVQGRRIHDGLFRQLHLASSSGTSMQGVSGGGLWWKWEIGVKGKVISYHFMFPNWKWKCCSGKILFSVSCRFLSSFELCQILGSSLICFSSDYDYYQTGNQ